MTHETGPERRLRPEPPSRREAASGLGRELEAAGVESPRLEAERLVAHAVGVKRSELPADWDRHLTLEEAGRLARAAGRRFAGEPLQHIEGTVEFRSLVLRSDPRALIPRPETEQLVERILQWVRKRATGAGSSGGEAAAAKGGVVRLRGPARLGGRPCLGDVLDIGTGSGAIALSLAVEGIADRVVGIDLSREALAQAEENRALAGAAGRRVELRLTDETVWGGIAPGERFDLIVSNPPYVSDAELAMLAPEVNEREPRVALEGGPAGLNVIRRIAGSAARHLRPEGALFLEIGAAQGAAVRALFAERDEWLEVKVMKDLAGRDRFVRVEPAPRPDAGSRGS
ncbi:MAG: peptide chain release factor N(5)-glutamine methyltransferase [Gemmatimonadota bacterium]